MNLFERIIILARIEKNKLKNKNLSDICTGIVWIGLFALVILWILFN